MDNAARRNEIINILSRSQKPVNSTVLSQRCAVSRQIIVGDIAILRAEGTEIISTPRGYQLLKVEEKGRRKIFVCRHGMDKMRAELEAIIDNGGIVENVVVEHEVYGTLEAKLNLRSRRDLQHYLSLMLESGAEMLCCLSGGVHTHAVRADTEEELEVIRQALEELKILYHG